MAYFKNAHGLALLILIGVTSCTDRSEPKTQPQPVVVGPGVQPSRPQKPEPQKPTPEKGDADKTKDTIADALMRGDKDAADKLLFAGADPNEKSATGELALSIAVEREEWLLVADLLRKGARVNVKDKNGEAAIHIATRKRNFSILDDLLRAGANPNQRSTSGETALFIAMRQGDSLSVDVLLNNGADPNEKSASGELPLFFLVERGDWYLVKKLLTKGANTKAKNQDSESPLHVAIRKGERVTVQELLEAGADANEAFPSGKLPIFFAAEGKFCGIVGLLLNHGARKDAKDADGNSPLHVAVKASSECNTSELLLKGADVNEKNSMGETALHIATKKSPRDSDLIRDLIWRRANQDLQDADGNTPLHLAALANDKTLYNYMKLYGAKENIANHLGKTARDILYSDVHVLDLLENKLKSTPIMGLKNELITPLELQEFKNIDVGKLTADLRGRYTDLNTKISEQIAKVTHQSQPLATDPCLRNQQWYQIIEDRSIKLWLWDSFGSLIPSLDPLLPKNRVAEHCHSGDLVRHLKNANRTHESETSGKPFEKVAIQGAGPSGLLAALELYSTGAQILIFEKRKAEYERKQILRLDPKWRATLQYFLADDFDSILLRGKARINTDDDTVEIPARELELALKHRLDEQIAHDPKNIKFFAAEIIQVNEANGSIEYKEDNVVEHVEATQLILAGGASNRLRNTVLGEAEVRTPEKMYAVMAFDKDASVNNKKCLLAKNFREGLSPSRVALMVGELCKSDNFKDSFHCSYRDFERGIDARQFETSEVVYFGIELPNLVIDLFKECNEHEAAQSATCRKNLAHALAIAAQSQIVDPLSCPYSELTLVESSTSAFALSQKVVEHTAKLMFFSAILHYLAITAIGDALASPHFFSGSGLSGARQSVEDLRDLYKISFTEYENAVSLHAQKTIEFTLQRGAPYFD